MAFSKAKIQRFNEVVGCAPPPGTYQPKWKEKPLLGIFEKGRRFNDKAEMNDTPMKTPALQKKEPLKSHSSRRLTCPKLQDELFSRSSSAASSLKDENSMVELVQPKTCDCNVMTDNIVKKYEDTIESLMDRLKVLSRVSESTHHSTDSEKDIIKRDSHQTESIHDAISPSYQQEIIEYRLKIAELQDTIDCLTAEKNVLNMDYFKMKKCIDELEEEIEAKNLKISEAESLAKSEGESIDVLKRGIHHLKADLQDSKCQIEDLQEKFDSINQELILEKSKKEELQARYESVLNVAKGEVSKKSEEIEVLKNSLKEKLLIIDNVEKIRAEEIQNISNELDKMKQLYDTNQVRNRELEEELCSTRKELATAVYKLDELSLLREGIESCFQSFMSDVGDAENIMFMNRERTTADGILNFLKCLMKAKNELDLLNKELLSKIEEKELHIQNLEQLIGPFREQLENYEQERLALENLTKQTKGEFEALSLQHAALLGHQNHKQKIQYMVKLKEKNLHLLDEIEDLRGKLRQKERIIAKLSNQSKDEPKTPSKALHRSRKENASNS